MRRRRLPIRVATTLLIITDIDTLMIEIYVTPRLPPRHY
jgi:hypothetical protein